MLWGLGNLLSYNAFADTKSCEKNNTCLSHLQQFTHVPSLGLKGYNIEELINISPEVCAKACLEPERSKWCVSFDYNKTAKMCYLSNKTFEEVALNSNYENNKYDHYSLKNIKNRVCVDGNCNFYAEFFDFRENVSVNGNTFEELTDMDVEGCAAACLSSMRSEWCLSFRFDKVKKRCMFGSKRVQDLDSGSFYETEQYDLYGLKNVVYWYETAYWKVVIITLPILLAFTYFQFRNRRLRKQTQKLEREVKQRTQVISDQNKELIRLNNARNIFFTNVAHELRTPLTLTIVPLEEIIDGKYNDDDKSKDNAMKLVLNSARSMLELVNQVLDLSRMESGVLSLTLKPIELFSEIKAYTEPFKLLAEKYNIKFLCSYTEAKVVSKADPKGLKSIIDNLLSNALKFTSEGGEVEFRLLVKGKLIEIQVEDNGYGIAESELPYIFDQYYQAESKEVALYSGTGIGLAMVREYVELHGGEVYVSSRLGEGTTFRVELPIIEPDSQNNNELLATKNSEISTSIVTTQQTVHSISEKIDTGSDDCPTILIVEDNDDLRQFLLERLSKNYRVLEAENGQQGLDLAQEKIPDVIVSDIMMPIMDGCVFCEAVKSNHKTNFIPFILLTAKATDDNIVEGINIGADDYLAKPFSMPELFARINRLIESRVLLRQRFSDEISKSLGVSTFDSSSKQLCDDDKFLSDIRKIVFANEFESLTVNELADAMSMERTTLYRKIKKTTGKPPADAIRAIRLEEAAKLFSSKQANVTEAAYTVGFKSIGHFSRSFSKHFGESPSDYKMRYCN